MSGTLATLPASSPYSTSRRAPGRIPLRGHCSINGSPDAACLAVELAITRLSVESNVAVGSGDNVIFSFPEFGLVEATVELPFPGGFTAHFHASTDSKLALYLAWLQEAPRAEDNGERAAPRITPVNKIVTLGREGEPTSMARIVDLSRAGVSVTTTKALTPDEPIMVGPRPGHVVRVFEGGAAVAFDEPIEPERFDPLIELRAPA